MVPLKLRHSASEHDVLESLPVGVVDTDPLGVIGYCNVLAARIHGSSPEALLGMSIWELILDEAEAEELRTTVEDAALLNTTRPYVTVHRSLTDSVPVPVAVLWSAKRDVAGSIQGMSFVIQLQERFFWARRLETAVGDVGQALSRLERLLGFSGQTSPPPASATQPRASVALTRLSLREREVLRQVLRGRTTEESADNLGISVHTVRNHIKGIYRKLDVHSREGLFSLFVSTPTD